MEVSPDSLVFGSLGKGVMVEAVVVVENFSDHMWEGVTTETADPCLSFHAIPMPVDPSRLPRQAWRVLVRLDPGKVSANRHRTEFLVREKPERTHRADFRVPVEARLVPAIEVIPDQMFFGTVGVGSSSERNVLVRFSPNCLPRSVQHVVLRHDLGRILNVRWIRVSGEFWELRGTLMPVEGIDLVEGKITIGLPFSIGSTVDLPVRARVTRK